MHWQGCAAYRIHSAILSALSFARHTLMLIWIISGGGEGGREEEDGTTVLSPKASSTFLGKVEGCCRLWVSSVPHLVSHPLCPGTTAGPFPAGHSSGEYALHCS